MPEFMVSECDYWSKAVHYRSPTTKTGQCRETGNFGLVSVGRTILLGIEFFLDTYKTLLYTNLLLQPAIASRILSYSGILAILELYRVKEPRFHWIASEGHLVRSSTSLQRTKLICEFDEDLVVAAVLLTPDEQPLNRTVVLRELLTNLLQKIVFLDLVRDVQLIEHALQLDDVRHVAEFSFIVIRGLHIALLAADDLSHRRHPSTTFFVRAPFALGGLRDDGGRDTLAFCTQTLTFLPTHFCHQACSETLLTRYLGR